MYDLMPITLKTNSYYSAYIIAFKNLCTLSCACRSIAFSNLEQNLYFPQIKRVHFQNTTRQNCED